LARLPALVVAAYVVLAGSYFAYRLGASSDVGPVYAAVVAGWAGLALALLLRRRWAAILLLIFEYLALLGWLSGSGDWGLFTLQIVLVALIADPLVDEYVRRDRGQGPNREYSIGTIVFMGALLLWALVLAVQGDPDALKPVVMAGFLGFEWYRAVSSRR
jgi:hypothetical protein